MLYNVLIITPVCSPNVSFAKTLNVSLVFEGILEEIRHYSADIICLQEVEFKQYADFFRAELQKDGYNGMHFSKSRAQIAATNMEAEKVDGCAIFWRDNK